MSSDPRVRALRERWLLELTQIPTAAGKEQRVIAWITEFVRQRPGLTLETLASGNLLLRLSTDTHDASDSHRPLYLSAHMDHPGFVVERIVAPTLVEAAFRGGVRAEYFPGARVRFFDRSDAAHEGKVLEKAPSTEGGFDHWLIELDAPVNPAAHASHTLARGDIGRWLFPPGELRDGQIHTDTCDNLAALAAGLFAMDELAASAHTDPAPGADRGRGHASTPTMRLLLTRAEEIGFIGAIAACRAGSIPRSARVIVLENSRSFSDSPIGAGPIVRVGDRVSVFSPGLTAAVAACAESLSVQAKQRGGSWLWQRKLMPGGACEASVFCTFGFESTCVCLPLGNYHNMGDLDAVQAGTHARPPTLGREFVSLDDFHNLVDLLVACATRLDQSPSFAQRLETLWQSHKEVLDER
ncbi:MAG: hypothetical protein SFZ23_16120 [Planctomycetota bacterium]|nr:hypothetical protein [Planctomycetota bacterium]